MPWIEDLLGKHILIDGVALPDRKNLNLINGVHGNVAAADNPGTNATDVTLGPPVNTGIDPMAAYGATTYPAPSQYAIALGATFVRTASVDGASIRFFGESVDEPTPAAFQQGRVTNMSDQAINLYPITTKTIYVNGTSLGTDNPINIAIGATVWWALDDNLDPHISA